MIISYNTLSRNDAKSSSYSRSFPFCLASILLACVLLSGCATPLTPAHDGPRFSAITGVPPKDVQFISYCGFAQGQGGGSWRKFENGIFALTPQGIHILEGELDSGLLSPQIVLPTARMTGVALNKFGRSRQLQIWSGESMLVVQLTANKELIDAAGSEEVFEQLKQRGVPPRDSSHCIFATPDIYYVPIPVTR